MQFLPIFQPTPSQFPSRGPWTAFNPVNLLSMAPNDAESPFCQLVSPVLAVSPSSSLCPSSLLTAGAWEDQKSLTWYKHYLAAARNISVLPTLLSYKIQNTTPYQQNGNKINCINRNKINRLLPPAPVMMIPPPVTRQGLPTSYSHHWPQMLMYETKQWNTELSNLEMLTSCLYLGAAI